MPNGYILVYRVGVLEGCLGIISVYRDQTPNNPVLQEKLSSLGATLRKPGQPVDTKAIEEAMLNYNT